MKQKKKEAARRQSVAKPQPKPLTDPMAQVTFDAERKSWMGPVTGQKDTLLMTKAVYEREKQLKSQDAESLKHNRKKVQRTQTPDLEEDEETATKDEELNIQTAYIEKPFNSLLQDAKTAKWGATVTPGDRSAISITFEKPAKSEQSHFLSSSQKVIRLEQDLEKKDQEISLLRRQLEKAHRENNKLVEKLKGYTGQRYEEIAKENAQLKEAVERLSRQNVKLEGEKRKDNNTKIQQMDHERELEEKHASDWQKNTQNKSQDPEKVNFKVTPRKQQDQEEKQSNCPEE